MEVKRTWVTCQIGDIVTPAWDAPSICTIQLQGQVLSTNSIQQLPHDVHERSSPAMTKTCLDAE